MKTQGRDSTRVATCRCYHTIPTKLWRQLNKCMSCSINKNRHIRILLSWVSSKMSFNNYTFLQFPHKVDTSVWELTNILISWCHISALKVYHFWWSKVMQGKTWLYPEWWRSSFLCVLDLLIHVICFSFLITLGRQRRAVEVLTAFQFLQVSNIPWIWGFKAVFTILYCSIKSFWYLALYHE